MVIENFNELSEQELLKIAEELVAKINSESIFTDEATLKVLEVEADKLTGNLSIYANTEEPITVGRYAGWSAVDEDSLTADMDDVEYYGSIKEETLECLLKTSEVIDGYKVTLTIDDVWEEDIVDKEVTTYSSADAGIGSYEYFGYSGYDSIPYVEVEGIIYKACYPTFELTIEPV